MSDGTLYQRARRREERAEERPSQLVPRLFLIAVAVLAMLALLALLATRPRVQPEQSSAEVLRAGRPIAAEADVFRSQPGGLLVEQPGRATRTGHRRTLASFRSRREYPGAPPRIPHGLTTDEFLGGDCISCHATGGFSPRFGTFVPVTPHPEWTQCLQCHAPSDELVGTPLPQVGVDGLCRQCHVPASQRTELPEIDWAGATWPPLGRTALPGAPPPIPHSLALRGNCLACHMGPGAVVEIRTHHPERGNCRQCHMALISDESEFRRPGAIGGDGPG